MEKITVGIPKALLYYRYKDLWIHFFEELGIDIIISPNTNRQILEDGKKYAVDETCLSLKIFLGHVYYLIGQCDYILVPRMKSVKKKEKLCTNFQALYDLTRNIFDVPLLNYNIDVEKKEDDFYAFVGMGLQLGFPYRESVAAYKKARELASIENEKRISKQKALLGKSTRTKILIAGHNYNLYDQYIGRPIIEYLEKQNIDLIYSDIYDQKYLNSEVERISKRNYWTWNREIIGAIAHYRKRIDGIILISTFPCGPDSLSNEMILRSVKDVPILTLVMDELNSEAGLVTRLESFIDMLEERSHHGESN